MLLLQQRHGLSLHPPLRLHRRLHARLFDGGLGHLLQLRRVLVIFESIGLMPCLELREGDTMACEGHESKRRTWRGRGGFGRGEGEAKARG
jgi:hypothetical protein